MAKKMLMIFVYSCLILIASKVQAMSNGEQIQPKVETLDRLIEYKTDSTWQYLEVNKYTKEDMTIYQEGNRLINMEQITVKQENNNEALMKILQSGNRKSEPDESFNIPDNDLYVATKIAIDCFNSGKNSSQLEEYYREGTSLEGKQRDRAGNIILASKGLLDKAYDETNPNIASMEMSESGKMEEEDLMKLSEGVGPLSEAEMYIDDTPRNICNRNKSKM